MGNLNDISHDSNGEQLQAVADRLPVLRQCLCSCIAFEHEAVYFVSWELGFESRWGWGGGGWIFFPNLCKSSNLHAQPLIGAKYLAVFKFIYEPEYDKTNKMTWAPSEDSDQPGHPPSLIRVFTVAKDLSFLQTDREDSDQIVWLPRLIRVFAGTQVILLVLSCCDSYYINEQKRLCQYCVR